MAAPELLTDSERDNENRVITYTFAKQPCRIYADAMQVLSDEGIVVFRRGGSDVGFINQSGTVIVLDEVQSKVCSPDKRVWLVWTRRGQRKRFMAECLHPEQTGFASLRSDGKTVAFVTPEGIVSGFENYNIPAAC